MKQIIFGTGNMGRLVNILTIVLPAVLFLLLKSEKLAMAWTSFAFGVFVPSTTGRKGDVLPKLVDRKDDPLSEGKRPAD